MNRSFFLISSFLVSDVSESLISLKSNERCERIAHFAHQKWATMSDSLRLLRGNERSWVNHSGRLFLDKKRAIHSEIKWANSQRCKIGWAILNFFFFFVNRKVQLCFLEWSVSREFVSWFKPILASAKHAKVILNSFTTLPPKLRLCSVHPSAESSSSVCIIPWSPALRFTSHRGVRIKNFAGPGYS